MFAIFINARTHFWTYISKQSVKCGYNLYYTFLFFFFKLNIYLFAFVGIVLLHKSVQNAAITSFWVTDRFYSWRHFYICCVHHFELTSFCHNYIIHFCQPLTFVHRHCNPFLNVSVLLVKRAFLGMRKCYINTILWFEIRTIL